MTAPNFSNRFYSSGEDSINNSTLSQVDCAQ